MQLTSEQLEKAAQIAYEAWYEGCRSWGESSEKHKEDMRNAIAAAFAAVEPPQVDVSGDLVERMLDAFEARAGEGGVVSMTAALRVPREDASCQLPASPVVLMPDGTRLALEDPRVLGNFVSADPFTALREGVINSFLASRRARLLQPKTVEERVTITLQEGDFPYVVSVDGKKISAFGYEHSRDGSGAADFRRSLIAKLEGESQ